MYNSPLTLFYEPSERRPYSNTINKFMFMLSTINECPRNKFSVMCALETNIRQIDRFLRIAYENNLVTLDNKMLYITAKGKSLLKVWKE